MINAAERVQLQWWYFITIASTIYCKYIYLDSVYRDGIASTVNNYLGGSTLLDTYFFSLLFLRDFSEVFLLLGIIYLIGNKLLRISVSTLTFCSLILIILLDFSNLLSLRSVNNLFSIDNFLVTIHWMKDNPDILKPYLRKYNIAYILLMFAVALLPYTASILYKKYNISTAFVNFVTKFFVTLISISMLLYYFVGLTLTENTSNIPYKGYWQSLAVSTLKLDEANPLIRDIPSLENIKSEYFKLVYANGNNKKIDINSKIQKENLNKKKHIVIISLETAPLKYYPIANNPNFNNFFKISKNSIISDLHFTNTPYTNLATYAILTGTYPNNGQLPINYGPIKSDSLANVLINHDYTPFYIDSYKIDWHPGNRNRSVIDSIGFKNIYDRNSFDFKNNIKARFKNKYDQALQSEAVSFERAFDYILEASAEDKKALIFIDTIMGHYDWKSKEDSNAPLSTQPATNLRTKSAKKILNMAQEFDKLLGALLNKIEKHSLTDEIIIVVTGDHGLRYSDEFESLNEPKDNKMVAYNVPLIIYAPSLIKEQIKLSQPTSHVDIAPVLLFMNGIDTSPFLHHGGNFLNTAMDERIVFMMNQSLNPNNSFLWKKKFYTYNNLTGESYITLYPGQENVSNQTGSNINNFSINSKHIIKQAEENFLDTAALFMQRNTNSRSLN